jgi:hypothetical protein
MSLLDLIRPKYQNHNPAVRLVAVRKLDNMQVLTGIALNDLSHDVRNEAVSRISDESFLEEIVMKNKFHETALTALEKISHEATIFLIVIKVKDLNIRNAAIELIHEEEFLAEILKNCDCLSTCIAATKRITNANLLRELHLRESHNPQILMAIRDRIKHLSESRS